MDKKAAAILGGLAAAAGLAVVVALATKAEAALPPADKFTCIWGDGFTANTWEEMAEHYRTAHPDKPIVQLVEVAWS